MVKNSITSALQDKEVVEFTKKTLLVSYDGFFPDHKKEINDMVTEAVFLLQESQKIKQDVEAVYRIADYISKAIFKKGDFHFWFNKGYKDYKFKIRSKEDYKIIRNDIRGPNVLDFGSNGGHFALELFNNEYNVFTTDVLDHREPEAKHLFFSKMSSPVNIPFKKNSFNTVIVKTVFHHIEDKHLIKILHKLNQITERLIVKEDIYGINGNLKKEITGNKELLIAHRKLTKEQQLKYLVLMDFFGNVVAYGISDISLPFNFKTINEWKEMFQKYGFMVKKNMITGFEITKMHASIQAWFILDKKKN